MSLQELFRQFHAGLRRLFRFDRYSFLPPVRFLQILALERARDRYFSLRAAADSTNIGLKRRTGPASAAQAAAFAQNWFVHLIPYYRINGMKRIDLYIKVEVEMGEDETAEKLAKEICRQIEKIYVVRKAELSNAVARD
jgi:hypothetical protein